MIPHIPSRLLDSPWVAWRYEPAPDRAKPAKVPINPRTGRRASVTNPSTWSDYQTAVAALRRFHLSGVGIVLPPDPIGLTGVDLDQCLDPATGRIDAWAKEILDHLPGTYAELSPSHEGIRSFVEGILPTGCRNRAGDIEAYSTGRFLTITGDVLPDRPLVVTDADEGLAWLVARYLAQRPFVVPAPVSAGYGRDDSELVRRAIRQPITGPRLEALLAGQSLDHCSQSEADYELCRILGFWCGRDSDRVEEIARASSAYRPKWDERRGQTTWFTRTVQQALARLTKVYTPGACPSRKTQKREDKECVTFALPQKRSRSTDFEALLAYLRELRLIHRRPVALSARQAATVLGVPFKTAARRLKKLVGNCQLVLVSEGNNQTRHASVYDLPEFSRSTIPVERRDDKCGVIPRPPYTLTPCGLFAVWRWSPSQRKWLHFGDCATRESALAVAGQHMAHWPGWWSVGDELRRYARGRGLFVRRHRPERD
jgi:putative DNA primase/helicase